MLQHAAASRQATRAAVTLQTVARILWVMEMSRLKASKCSLRSEIPLIGSRLGAGGQIIRGQPLG